MKNPIQMSNDQVYHWAKKTRNSIYTFVNSGGLSNSRRGYDLVDRYELLKEEMQNRHFWDEYCSMDGADTSHTAFDLFA